MSTQLNISKDYTIPTPEILEQVGQSEKITNAFAFAHQVCDSGGRLLHYGALCGKRYAITAEQKQQAEAEYKRMKASKINSIGGKLVFVGMGMEYPAKYEGDVCNHRIRTEIINPAGRRFFIEVGTGRGENMRIDHVVDRDQQQEYEAKASEYYQKIEQAGGFLKVGKGHHLYEQLEKYRAQPYYWYKKDEWFSLNVKYTQQNVLNLVNKLFDCNFSEMEIDSYLLTTEDYISTSPNN